MALTVLTVKMDATVKTVLKGLLDKTRKAVL
jgi:hypothetical protein